MNENTSAAAITIGIAFNIASCCHGVVVGTSVEQHTMMPAVDIHGIHSVIVRIGVEDNA